MNEKLPSVHQKVIQDHPSTLGPAGGAPRGRRPPAKAVVPAIPSKSQGAGMVLDDFLSGIPIEKAQKGNFSFIFSRFFRRFSIYLASSGAKYREKGLAASRIGEG